MAATLEANKSIADFQRNLRAQVRLFWDGDYTTGQLQVGMLDAIQRGFTQAWKAGAAECGIKFDELTNEETSMLQQRVNEQMSHISNFVGRISPNVRSEGGKLSPLYRQLDVWVIRYEEIRNQAKAMACADRKLEWTLGVAEHCSSCQKLAGKVKRGSFWTESGILPRRAGAGYLECQGFRCQCTLVPTDRPISKGPLPSLP